MKITRRFFWAIFFLALLLPLSKNWRLLLFGNKTYGVVSGYSKGNYANANNSYRYRDTYSVIKFTSDHEEVSFLGPDNLILPVGKKIRIYYDPRHPTHCIPLHFTSLYLGKQMIIPAVFLFLWVALYTALKQTEQQKKRAAVHRNSGSIRGEYKGR
jgi:hypothetical protein